MVAVLQRVVREASLRALPICMPYDLAISSKDLKEGKECTVEQKEQPVQRS